MNTKKLTVLTTTGRRQILNINPGTTLLQVLEQVCQKYDLVSAEHGLMHHNKELDLSLMFRFTGLPNNCQLEMFATKTTRDDNMDVVVCIQQEDGTRSQGTFKSVEMLSGVLDKLCPNLSKPDQNPIIIYMRREIHGDELNTTTLKSLGITEGRAMLRLLNKNPEDLKTQANVYIPPTVKENEPMVIDDEPPKRTSVITSTQKLCLRLGRSRCLSDINITNETVKALKDENAKIDENIATTSLASEKPPLPTAAAAKEDVKVVKAPDWGTGSGRVMNEKGIDDQDLGDDDNGLDNIDEPVVYELGERNAVLFSLDSSEKNVEEIPDSFFDLTVDDLKLLLRDLREQASGNDNGPLLTKKMRELEESKCILNKMAQYKKCVIRIQFPDRFVLQGTFRPVENVETVYDFVRSYLKDQTLNFVLFTIPPKTILPTNMTLVEVDCVPTAVLHFGVENDNFNKDSTECYLRDDILEKLTSPDGALLSATKSRSLPYQKPKIQTVINKNEDTSDVLKDGPGPSKGAIPKKPKSDEFKESSAVPKPDGRIPKWFQPTKK